MAVTADAAPAVAFKGRMMTLTVLEVRHSDLATIADDLAKHLERGREFFRGMPILLSLAVEDVDLPALADLLRGHDLMPVAVLDGDPVTAGAAGLGVIASRHMLSGRSDRQSEARQSRPQSRPENRDKGPRDVEPRGAARLINRPIRSGQQVYARGSDLVITSSVSEGAEVLADGHIHVYGSLRGRALAGAAGDAEARIFCHRFEPELVAVAGCYKVADDIDEGVRGKAVQVRLTEDNLLIETQE